ncbi:MAG: prepilin-type N-terminal cleavage/methylation domain-containing protein [Rubrivivax sp.]|nr:prepilin-type N-terminal cleavage/methylation domain-containing protein [Rubrivivax sp.]
MKRCTQHGFTLVEVLVALMIMAILAGLSWQGLDAVMKARDASRESINRTTRLTTVLVQWQQDLEAIYDSGVVPALEFDGQTLRLTRRVDDGVALVAWSVRGGVWQRWSSAAVQRSGALQENWLASQQFLGNEPGQLKVADGATEWQLYFFRGNAWSNAQSSAGTSSNPSQPPPAGPPPVQRADLPQGVRIVITLPAGKLTRDVALGPSGS